MEFLLIRHGKAEAHGHPEGDAARGLIEKGHRQAERVGKFLVAHDLVPDLVLTSPLRRARETAEGFCTSAGIDPPVVQEWLHAMYPENSLQELAVYSGTCSRVAAAYCISSSTVAMEEAKRGCGRSATTTEPEPRQERTVVKTESRSSREVEQPQEQVEPDPEPLPRDHPLLQLDNVVIAPHLGSATAQTPIAGR